jgi:predicted aldo/keto reductase-like oxidoreductase
MPRFFAKNSNAFLDTILAAHPETEFVQLQLNDADWDSAAIQSRRCYEICVKQGKPVIVMDLVKGGDLARVPEEAENLLKAYAPDRSAALFCDPPFGKRHRHTLHLKPSGP